MNIEETAEKIINELGKPENGKLIHPRYSKKELILILQKSHGEVWEEAEKATKETIDMCPSCLYVNKHNIDKINNPYRSKE